MRTIQLTDADLMPNADALEGQHLDASHCDRVIEDSTTVLKPDGTPLLLYVRDALPRSLCRVAFDSFKHAPLHSNNRKMAAGVKGSPVPSGVVGFLDPEWKFPSCRMTALSLNHLAEYKAAQPFFVTVSRQFEILAADRWAAQRAFVDNVAPDFKIPHTNFTTITVNRSWRTAAHRDAEDYRKGFGVMAALEGGHFAGGELVFPKFRTAVDLRTGGLLLADVHELHGNAPLIVRKPSQRLSFVFYAREKMAACGSAAEELERAKRMS